MYERQIVNSKVVTEEKTEMHLILDYHFTKLSHVLNIGMFKPV